MQSSTTRDEAATRVSVLGGESKQDQVSHKRGKCECVVNTLIKHYPDSATTKILGISSDPERTKYATKRSDNGLT